MNAPPCQLCSCDVLHFLSAGLPELIEIGASAFEAVLGNLSVIGDFPKLVVVKESAFRNNSATAIVALNGLAALSNIMSAGIPSPSSLHHQHA